MHLDVYVWLPRRPPVVELQPRNPPSAERKGATLRALRQVVRQNGGASGGANPVSDSPAAAAAPTVVALPDPDAPDRLLLVACDVGDRPGVMRDISDVLFCRADMFLLSDSPSPRSIHVISRGVAAARIHGICSGCGVAATRLRGISTRRHPTASPRLIPRRRHAAAAAPPRPAPAGPRRAPLAPGPLLGSGRRRPAVHHVLALRGARPRRGPRRRRGEARRGHDPRGAVAGRRRNAFPLLPNSRALPFSSRF